MRIAALSDIHGNLAALESVLAAAAVGARSVALPAVSAGVYGWAGPTVARLAVAGVAEALADLAAPEPESLPWPAGTGRRVELVRFVLFNDALLGDFEAALAANPLGGLEPTP